LPFAVRDTLANKARKGSKAHTQRAAPQIQDVNPQAVELAFRTTGVRRIIHGHTHRPAIHDLLIDGEPAQRIVLGAWYEEGSYLVYENGHYELKILQRRP
jgi:UDP-2,3-diacylglucosamine hydrolase